MILVYPVPYVPFHRATIVPFTLAPPKLLLSDGGSLARSTHDLAGTQRSEDMLVPLVAPTPPSDLWNRITLGKQMMSDASRLVRPGTVAQWSAVKTATR